MADLIKQFQDVCNCDETEAKHFLEAFNNDLESAIGAYLAENLQTSSDLDPQQASSANSNAKPTASNKFATLSSLSNCSSDEEEQGQAFYVGGSEGGGGQQVLGPKKDKPPQRLGNNEDMITKLFQSAREGGAEVLDTARVEDSSHGKPRIKAFTGTAYRLGTDLAQPSERVVPFGSAREPARQQATVIKMWNNGFSLDDGPLRDFNDAASQEFLNSIQRGEVPEELLRTVQSGQANVMLEDHRNEEYKAPPKPKIVPFSGSGQMLGHPSPKIVASAAAATNTPAPAGPEVDSSKPTTKLQIRLSDGSRLQVELNHSHTVGDVRRAILNQRPNYLGVAFNLMTTFPNKELSEDALTLEEGKLLNCSLVQKLV